MSKRDIVAIKTNIRQGIAEKTQPGSVTRGNVAVPIDDIVDTGIFDWSALYAYSLTQKCFFVIAGKTRMYECIVATAPGQSPATHPLKWRAITGDTVQTDPFYVGRFATDTALIAAIPTGEFGQYANVSSTNTIWIWDETPGEWVNSAQPIAVITLANNTEFGAGVNNKAASPDQVINLSEIHMKLTPSNPSDAPDLPLTGGKISPRAFLDWVLGKMKLKANDADVVKSISLNAGTPVEPDNDGNVDLTIANNPGGNANGERIVWVVEGANFTAGKAYAYDQATGTWALADYNNTSDHIITGFAISTTEFVSYGRVSGLDALGFAPNTNYYLSTTTPGELVDDADPDAGSLVLATMVGGLGKVFDDGRAVAQGPGGSSYTDAMARAAVIENLTARTDRAWSSQTTKSYVDDLINGLATVADTGSYNDLIDKPNLAVYALLSGASFSGNISALNLSGNNTGDETTTSILTKIGNGSKISTSYLPDAILGQVVYQGTYNASTGLANPTPGGGTGTLPGAASGNKGYYWIVTAAGTQFGLDLGVGDWIISNGTAYDKVDNTDAIASFNGRTGPISLLSADVTGALGYTPVSLSGSYANPTWITSLAYSKITGAPTNVSQFTNDAGYLTSASLPPSGSANNQTLRWTGSAYQWGSYLLNSGSELSVNGAIDTTAHIKAYSGATAGKHGLLIRNVMDNNSYGAAASFQPDHHPIYLSSQYLATTAKVTNPYDFNHGGITSVFEYGSGSVTASGTTHNFTGYSVIYKSEATSEHSVYMGTLQYETGALGRAWFADFNLIGSTVQQEILGGVSMMINNCYNGSPSKSPSFGMAVVTNPGAGGFADATYGRTTYKVDAGFLVAGYAGTDAAPTRGFEKGIQVGGRGTGWMETGSSRIGTGIYVTDVEEYVLNADVFGYNAAVRVQAKNADKSAYVQLFNHLGGYFSFGTNATAGGNSSAYVDTSTETLQFYQGFASGKVQFFVGGYAAGNERLTMLASGNVGVGATAPQDVLEVRKDQATTNVATTTKLIVNNGNASGISAFAFYNGTNMRAALQFNNASPNLFMYTLASHDLYLGTNSSIRMAIGGTDGTVKTGANAYFGDTSTTPTARVDVAASTSTVAQLRLRNGVAVTSPNRGDIWNEGDTLKYRRNSDTRDILTGVPGSIRIGSNDISITNSSKATKIYASMSNYSFDSTLDQTSVGANFSWISNTATIDNTGFGASRLILNAGNANNLSGIGLNIFTIGGAAERTALYTTLTSDGLVSMTQHYGNMGLFATAPAPMHSHNHSQYYGGGVGIFYMAQATTAPTGNPTGGAWWWWDGTNVNIKKPSGTIVTL